MTQEPSTAAAAVNDRRGLAPGLSLYLDLLRFFLAFIVLLTHVQSMGYTNGVFYWRAYAFGRPAVMGFFVLSGFVIAYVVDRRERDLPSYAASRISRLYSVLLPALALTAILDAIGWRLLPEHYLHAPLDIGVTDAPLRYALALVMASSVGIVGLFQGTYDGNFIPGTNAPLWSLSNEVIYYLAFAATIFCAGRRRIILLVVIAIVAGPMILAEYPIWLLGVGVYRVLKRRPPRPGLSGLTFVLSWLLLIGVGAPSTDPWLSSVVTNQIANDLVVGLLFAVNIYAAGGLAAFFARHLSRHATMIRWLGTATFPLYLSHRPVLQFVSGIHVGQVGGVAQTLWILGWIAAATILLTLLSEPLRAMIRTRLMRWWKPDLVGAAAVSAPTA
jgi:peptidoglycan/LPS O-acetylase OafA/YrhL